MSVGSAILSVKGVTKKFGGLIALNKVTLDVHEGELLGIIGPNGAGKTTLFNVITGFLKPEEGRILYRGKDITGLPPYKIAKMGISRTFQIVKPLSNMTVLDNVLVAAFNLTHNKEEATNIAIEALKFVGLYPKRYVRAASLNLVEKKKLELARALALKPKVLLLDEIACGLNQAEIFSAIDLIKKIHDEGITVIVVEHVMRFIARLVQRLIVLVNGTKIAEGTVDEVLNNPKVIEAYLGSKELII